MFRYGLVLAASVAACGVADDRPKNLTYITEAILAPTCGAATCHGQFRQEVGDEYDSVDAARRTMWLNATVVNDVHVSQVMIPPGSTSAADSYLIVTITKGSPSFLDASEGLVRMPYDAPMPNEDVALIEQWIQEGAVGAQCLPNVNLCGADGNVYTCTSDGNIGVFVPPGCTNGCMAGVPGSSTPGVCQ